VILFWQGGRRAFTALLQILNKIQFKRTFVGGFLQGRIIKNPQVTEIYD
jgi:hypothetical protein